MEKLSSSSPTVSENSRQNDKKNKRRLPSPREMVSHYEKQGMETQEASFKAIQDLQTALLRMITTNRNRKSAETTSSKLDSLHSRLLQLDMKMDSKPSYPQTLALGVASAGIWNAVLQLWNSVRQATDSS